MAKRTIYVDDITKKEIAPEKGGTVKVGLDGQWWEVDLSDESKKKLEQILEPYLVERVAAPTARSTAPRSTVDTQAREDSRAARAWAQGAGEKTVTEAGLKVPGDRGRVDGRIVELWEEAGRPKA